MKKLFGTMAVAAALFAGYNAYNAQNSKEYSNIVMANVEALAVNNESSSTIYKWSNSIDCPGWNTGDYQVCEANGSQNSCSNPGAKTCDCSLNNCD